MSSPTWQKVIETVGLAKIHIRNSDFGMGNSFCITVQRTKSHVEEAGMTAYLFKLNTEKTIYCKNAT